MLNCVAGERIPMLLHVHELDHWMGRCRPEHIQQQLQRAEAVIAASRAVERNLMLRGLEKERVKVIYEHITRTKLDALPSGQLRERLGLDKNVRLVGACGGEHWRKGKDWWVPLASEVIPNVEEEVHFVWIGGAVTPDLDFDWKHAPFRDRIHFIDHIPDAAACLRDLDVFVMLSREDPFPVVNLEAGFFGVPVVCFEGAGGTEELLEFDPDSVVPYGCLGAMGRRIVAFLEDSSLRSRMGEKLRQRVIHEFDVTVIGPQILAVMEEAMKNR
jgi:glycosyltransferase involved in cell wall biosynthesis